MKRVSASNPVAASGSLTTKFKSGDATSPTVTMPAAIGGGKIAAARATATGTIEQRELAAEALQHRFGRIAVLAGLILPFARLKLTLDENLRSFFQIEPQHPLRHSARGAGSSGSLISLGEVKESAPSEIEQWARAIRDRKVTQKYPPGSGINLPDLLKQAEYYR
jgi:hypothetical protein